MLPKEIAKLVPRNVVSSRTRSTHCRDLLAASHANHAPFTYSCRLLHSLMLLSDFKGTRTLPRGR